MLPTAVIIGIGLIFATRRDTHPWAIAGLGICFGVAIAAGRWGGTVETVNAALGDAGNSLLKSISDFIDGKKANAGLVALRYNAALVGIGR